MEETMTQEEKKTHRFNCTTFHLSKTTYLLSSYTLFAFGLNEFGTALQSINNLAQIVEIDQFAAFQISHIYASKEFCIILFKDGTMKGIGKQNQVRNNNIIPKMSF